MGNIINAQLVREKYPIIPKRKNRHTKLHSTGKNDHAIILIDFLVIFFFSKVNSFVYNRVTIFFELGRAIKNVIGIIIIAFIKVPKSSKYCHKLHL